MQYKKGTQSPELSVENVETTFILSEGHRPIDNSIFIFLFCHE